MARRKKSCKITERGQVRRNRRKAVKKGQNNRVIGDEQDCVLPSCPHNSKDASVVPAAMNVQNGTSHSISSIEHVPSGHVIPNSVPVCNSPAMDGIQDIDVMVHGRQQKHKARMELYRQRKRYEDPQYLKKQAERKRNYRKKRKIQYEADPDLLEYDRKMNAMRQQRYRDKWKDDAEKLQKKQKMLTRAEQEKRREYWREKKRAQRKEMKSQKKRRVREREHRRYMQRKSNTRAQESVAATASPQTSSNAGVSLESVDDSGTMPNLDGQDQCENICAENNPYSSEPPRTKERQREQWRLRQRARRIRKAMPRNATKYHSVLQHLVSGSTKPKLDEKGETKLARKVKVQLQKNADSGKSIADLLKNMKKHRSHRANIVKRCIALCLNRSKSTRSVARAAGMSNRLLHTYKSNEGIPDIFDRKTRADAVPPETVDKVTEQYMAHSTFVPDAKAVSKRTLEPPKVLDIPVQDVYQNFQQENPGTRISLSKFSKMRPAAVKTTRAKRLYQSKCEYCTNAKLKLEVFNSVCRSTENEMSVINDKNHLVDITLCPKEEGSAYHKLACIQRNCEECGVENLSRHATEVIQAARGKVLKWSYWTLIDTHVAGRKHKQKSLETKSGSISDLVKDLKQESSTLAQHLLVAYWQKECFDNLSKEVPLECIVLHMDYSENYSTFFQDEVSSAHWMKNLITVHPVVAYYNCADCGNNAKPVMDVLIFLSDDTTHDHHAVQRFYADTIRYLKGTRNLTFNKVYEFTDGCAGQYKSRGPFADISFGMDDLNITRERCYFGSCHGKGPCDGAGGVVKTLARLAVVRGTAIIKDAGSMYQFLNEKHCKPERVRNICNHSRREFFLVTDICRERPERAIKTTVKGTRQFHAIRGISPGIICTRNLMCVCPSCLAGLEECANKSHVYSWVMKRLNLINNPVPRRVVCGGEGTRVCDTIEHDVIEIPDAVNISANTDRDETCMTEHDIVEVPDAVNILADTDGEETGMTEHDIVEIPDSENISANTDGEETPMLEHDIVEVPDAANISANTDGEKTHMTEHDVVEIPDAANISANTDGEKTPMLEHDIVEVPDAENISVNPSGENTRMAEHDVIEIPGAENISANTEGEETPMLEHDIVKISDAENISGNSDSQFEDSLLVDGSLFSEGDSSFTMEPLITELLQSLGDNMFSSPEAYVQQPQDSEASLFTICLDSTKESTRDDDASHVQESEKEGKFTTRSDMEEPMRHVDSSSEEHSIASTFAMESTRDDDASYFRGSEKEWTLKMKDSSGYSTSAKCLGGKRGH